MKPLRIPLRAVIYREGDAWIAHCLEFDLIGDGASAEEAFQSLNQAIVVQLEACAKYDNLAGLFTPADGKYFRMFAAGKDLALGELPVIPGNAVTIEKVETRAYVDPVDSDVDLVPA